MIVTIQDSIGYVEYTNVAAITPTGENLWNIMYTDYETEEVQGRLTDVTMEGF